MSQAAKDYEDRPTFPIPTRSFTKKIALEEAVSTSVFNAAWTVPAIEQASELTYTRSYKYLEGIASSRFDAYFLRRPVLSRSFGKGPKMRNVNFL